MQHRQGRLPPTACWSSVAECSELAGDNGEEGSDAVAHVDVAAEGAWSEDTAGWWWRVVRSPRAAVVDNACLYVQLMCITAESGAERTKYCGCSSRTTSQQLQRISMNLPQPMTKPSTKAATYKQMTRQKMTRRM